MEMAKINEDVMLEHLSEDIDNALIKWLTTYEVPGLNLTAVILARLTWLAKEGNYTDDFIKLLESPKETLNKEDDKKVIH
jgi:hypothetical protein